MMMLFFPGGHDAQPRQRRSQRRAAREPQHKRVGRNGAASNDAFITACGIVSGKPSRSSRCTVGAVASGRVLSRTMVMATAATVAASTTTGRIIIVCVVGAAVPVAFMRIGGGIRVVIVCRRPCSVVGIAVPTRPVGDTVLRGEHRRAAAAVAGTVKCRWRGTRRSSCVIYLHTLIRSSKRFHNVVDFERLFLFVVAVRGSAPRRAIHWRAVASSAFHHGRASNFAGGHIASGCCRVAMEMLVNRKR